MIPFDPENPFPHLDFEQAPYPEAQAHAVEVDRWLGFDYESVEKSISQSAYTNDTSDVQIWNGLPVQALQTPYTEIRFMLELLKLQPGQKIIDLGSGYGRMAFVVGRCFPDVAFTGYEIVRERHEEGQRILGKFNFSNTHLICQDVSRTEFAPPVANHYFIFDFGSRSAIEKILRDLQTIARKKQIQLVARGRGIRHQIYRDHPWLTQIQPPQDHGHFTIFSS